MNRREFLKTSTAIAVAGAIPIHVMAETKHPFIEFAQNNFYVNDYKKGPILFETSKHHEELAQIYDDERFVLVKKYRQGGFSTLTILRALYECIHKENQSFVFIAKTCDQARRLKDVFDFSMHHMQLETLRNNSHVVEFKNGNTIRFMQPLSCCGCMFTTLVLDECAFWQDLENHYKAWYPTISTGGKLFMVSTPYKKEGYFYKLWKNENHFKKYSPSCFEHPYYTPEKIAFLKGSLGEKGWRQECLAEFQEEPF